MKVEKIRHFANDYDHFTDQEVDGRHVAIGLRIKCSTCSNEALAALPRGQRFSCEQMIADRMWATKGWYVGRNRKADQCPACREAKRKERELAKHRNVEPMKQEETVVMFTQKKNEGDKSVEINEPPTQHATFIQAEPPKEMTKEDFRIIFAELNTYYINDKVGYVEGWTDERIAKDLATPRAWVTKIRLDHFGVYTGDPKEKLIAEGRKLVQEMKDSIAQQQSEHIEAIQKLEKRLKDFVAAFEARVTVLQDWGE